MDGFDLTVTLYPPDTDAATDAAIIAEVDLVADGVAEVHPDPTRITVDALVEVRGTLQEPNVAGFPPLGWWSTSRVLLTKCVAMIRSQGAAVAQETVDLIKFLVAISLPALVGLITLVVTNRNTRTEAAAERAHQRALATLAAGERRTEQRFDERRVAFASLINEATRLRDEALEDEYSGRRRAPIDADVDPWDMDAHFQTLREAFNEVLLLGTKGTREAAESLSSATERYVFRWESKDYTAMDQALIDFRAAARTDLGIDGGAPDVAAEKPAHPESSARQRKQP